VRRRLSEEAVLSSAERLFVRNGFHGTKVDDIAKDAGLTKGAVYFHFKDKSNVLLALLRRAEDRVLVPILSRMRSADLSATEKIVEYLHGWARIALEQRDTLFLPILMSFEFLGTGDPIERQIKGMYDRIYDSLTAVVEQGRADGEFHDNVSAGAHVAVLVAISDGMLLEWLRRSDRFDGGEVTRALRQVMLSGLLRREPKELLAAPHLPERAPAAGPAKRATRKVSAA